MPFLSNPYIEPQGFNGANIVQYLLTCPSILNTQSSGIFYRSTTQINQALNPPQTKKKTKKSPAKKKTPLMTQYYEVKQQHPDALLLFRVGDFYETFGEDAVKCADILGIVLTSRNNGGDMTELAGFPYHSVDLYLPKLVRAGYRVAICEQLEKPSKEKKIVKRGVTEIVTPGVTSSDSLLSAKQNNFLASIYLDDKQASVAFLDISTGEFVVHQGRTIDIDKLIETFSPNEILYSKKQKDQITSLLSDEGYLFGLDDWLYEAQYNYDILTKHFNVISLKGIGIESDKLSQVTAGTILHYLSTIQQSNTTHIHQLSKLHSDQYLWLDRFTIRNLELVDSLHASGHSLREIIDYTLTPMGSRMLVKWIVLPLIDITRIQRRLDRVDALVMDESLREEIIAELKKIGDIERLASKIPLRKINPKEYVVIKNTLNLISTLKLLLKDRGGENFQKIEDHLSACQELFDLIDKTITDDAPVSLQKGHVIKTGCHEKLDEWKSISKNGKDLLLNLQQEQIEKTGISSLKVGYNNVFGYYYEVTNRFKDQGLIPEDWIRKQTLKGSERYINQPLKELEAKILQADEQIAELERTIYDDLVIRSEKHVPLLLSNAKLIAELDCYISLAHVAEKNDYTKPHISDSQEINIKAGRHPVIEKNLPATDPYVPNDVFLDTQSQQIILITGPNMSGKSAVLRQTAIITLMAHIGSFVPAQVAEIGLTDKIFTRVGATDNISSGESTFMVEMNETASILNNLSERSLIILDEIGRGTSTYDGISIAWAIAEYLHENQSFTPKTLFATHYHELSELENTYDRIKNYNVATKEIDGKIIFLRKLIAGASNSSFGVHVAQLAGMPKSIISKATDLLVKLEAKSIEKNNKTREKLKTSKSSNIQLNMFDTSTLKYKKIEEIIENIHIDTLTPIECMLKLKEIIETTKEDQNN